jgi:hypothetical protein
VTLPEDIILKMSVASTASRNAFRNSFSIDALLGNGGSNGVSPDAVAKSTVSVSTKGVAGSYNDHTVRGMPALVQVAAAAVKGSKNNQIIVTNPSPQKHPQSPSPRPHSRSRSRSQSSSHSQGCCSSRSRSSSISVDDGDHGDGGDDVDEDNDVDGYYDDDSDFRGHRGSPNLKGDSAMTLSQQQQQMLKMNGIPLSRLPGDYPRTRDGFPLPYGMPGKQQLMHGPGGLVPGLFPPPPPSHPWAMFGGGGGDVMAPRGGAGGPPGMLGTSAFHSPPSGDAAGDMMQRMQAAAQLQHSMHMHDWMARTGCYVPRYVDFSGRPIRLNILLNLHWQKV